MPSEASLQADAAMEAAINNMKEATNGKVGPLPARNNLAMPQMQGQPPPAIPQVVRSPLFDRALSSGPLQADFEPAILQMGSQPLIDMISVD